MQSIQYKMYVQHILQRHYYCKQTNDDLTTIQYTENTLKLEHLQPFLHLFICSGGNGR